MTETFPLKADVALGVVPTHLQFVGGLVPDENGKLPREKDGRIKTIVEMEYIAKHSPVKPNAVQVPCFPGASPDDISELCAGLAALGLAVHLVLMVGGANPMDPADEDAVIAQLVPSLKAAVANKAASVASTSIEEWMRPGESRRDGPDFDAAVAQNVKLHLRAMRESGLDQSSIDAWHIEFLRPGEFKTFTDLDRAWAFVKAANEALGKNFFKLLVDAAHCGDSGLSVAENQHLIAEIAAAGHLGIFHCSAPTTRGCLSTDDGWVGALLHAAAKTGELRTVFVELFHHADEGLEALRGIVAGHGIDTTDGRSYTEVTIDALVDTARRLNNLKARGIL